MLLLLLQNVCQKLPDFKEIFLKYYFIMETNENNYFITWSEYSKENSTS